MKRLLSILMALLFILPLPTARASGLGLDEKALTLPKKIEKQIADGSGIKGTLKCDISGDTFLGTLLGDGLHEAVIEFNYLLTNRMTKASQTNVTVKEGESIVATAGVDIDGDLLLLTGSFFGGVDLKLDAANLMNSILPNGGTQNKTAWETVLFKLFFSGDPLFEEDMKKALDVYGVQVEFWLSTRAKIENAENGTLNITYDISFRELAEEMKLLLETIVQDATVRALVEKKLSKEELDTYFNVDTLELYKIILDNVDVEGNLSVSQTMNTRDNTNETRIDIPLAKNAYGIEWLQLASSADAEVISVIGDMGTYSLVRKSAEDDKLEGVFSHTPPNGKPGGAPFAIAFHLEKEHKEWMDDEKKNNDTDSYTLLVQPDAETMKGSLLESEYLDFEPVTFSLQTAYRSGTAPTSATTLFVELKEARQNMSATLTLEGKTYAPWQPDSRDWEGAKPISHAEGIEALINGITEILVHFTPAMAGANP